MKLAYSITSSVVFFIIATIAFVTIKYAMRPLKAPTSDGPNISDNSWMVTAVYVFATLIAQIVANFVNAKIICKDSSQNFGLVFLYTIIPYFFILGTVMTLIIIFPAWLTPFSNTIGYACVLLLGLSTTFNKLLKTDPSGNALLTEICSDKALIINEMDQNNYADFMKEMASTSTRGKSQTSMLKDNYLRVDQDGDGKGGPYNKLYGLVILKNLISEGLWYALAGSLAISIANNVIINIQCSYDLKKIESMHEDIKAQQERSYAESNKKKPILYTKHT